MRWIFSTVGFAVIICFSTIAASPTQAAVLSVGPPSGSFVNESVCMDVEGNNPAPGTPVIASECHAGPNQQFQLAFAGRESPVGNNGWTLYALAAQRCVTLVPTASPESFTVVSDVCKQPSGPQSNFQAFVYFNGQIETVTPAFVGCLDAGNMQNGTQLVTAPCNGSDSQQWQIK
jgi:hypothetical protein